MKKNAISNALRTAAAILLWAGLAGAQAQPAAQQPAQAPAQAQPAQPQQPPGAGASKTCPDEIPTGVKIIPLPDADRMKVSLSDFSVSVDQDTSSYDLKMQVKNATDNWCITSLAIAYWFGDARGQEWLANEYPVVKKFTTVRPMPRPALRGQKAAPAARAHSVGLSPGQAETRTVFDVYFYIQPRPQDYFDGFHLISAEIKSCFGYPLDKTD